MTLRDRTEIISQILELAKDGGAKKTKIMYGASLSYAQLKEYLTVLEKNGLLHYDDILRVYKTTDKGFAFLKAYQQIGRMFGPANMEIACTTVLNKE